MKKECKKGFTLVELLAVIVILAVIALITTPMILGVIDKAKKGAFQSSVKGIENSIALQQLENEGKITNYTVVNGVITNTETNEIISTKGGTDINGNIKVKEDGRIIYALNNGKECIIKRDGQEEIEHIPNIKFCTMEVATNLVKNGYGEYGDNTNFSKFTYQDGAFILSSDTSIEFSSDELIKVDTSKKYEYAVDAKNNGKNTVYYLGLKQYDYDKELIRKYDISHIKNTLTTLARDLNDGDTVVYFTDLSDLSWKLTSNTINYDRGLIFWNYQNSSGYEYPAETYSRYYYYNKYEHDAINQFNHTITLKTPWKHGTFLAGTQVSRSSAPGRVHSYDLLEGKALTAEYRTYSNTMIGVRDFQMYPNYFTSATEYVNWFSINNSNNIPNTISYYKNIVIRESEK